MLQNAIANRNAAAQREAAYEQAKGKLWGDTVNNITKYAGRGIMASADQYSTDEDEAELEQLKAQKEQDAAIAKYREQVEQRRAFDKLFDDPYKEYGIYNPKYNPPQGASLSEEGTRSMQDYEPTFMYHDYYEIDNDEYNDWYNSKYNNPYSRYMAGRRGF